MDSKNSSRQGSKASNLSVHTDNKYSPKEKLKNSFSNILTPTYYQG